MLCTGCSLEKNFGESWIDRGEKKTFFKSEIHRPLLFRGGRDGPRISFSKETVNLDDERTNPKSGEGKNVQEK